MYIPRAFAEQDRETLAGMIRAYPFGLLVTTVDGVPFASHLPFLLEGERLLAHMARGNPHWRGFAAGGDSLAVFQGPHAYVSPRWYADAEAVPTWNYVAVHVYGRPRVIEDAAETRRLLDQLVEIYEAGAWRLGDRDAAYAARMMRGIVALEMPLARIEGKLKLSQNRPEADRRRVASELSAAKEPLAAELGRLMASGQRGE